MTARHEGLRLAGQMVGAGRAGHIAVDNPHTGGLVGTVPKATLAEVRQAFDIACAYKARLSRFERAHLLNKAASAVRNRSAEIAALITVTGGVAIGKTIASTSGSRRIVLELGGNDPIIVMDDADIDEASTLAASGSYKNSGQRCTAVKRMLVHDKVAAAFTNTKTYSIPWL